MQQMHENTCFAGTLGLRACEPVYPECGLLKVSNKPQKPIPKTIID